MLVWLIEFWISVLHTDIFYLCEDVILYISAHRCIISVTVGGDTTFGLSLWIYKQNMRVYQFYFLWVPNKSNHIFLYMSKLRTEIGSKIFEV